MINYPIIEWTFYNAAIKNKKLFIFSEKNSIKIKIIFNQREVQKIFIFFVIIKKK